MKFRIIILIAFASLATVTLVCPSSSSMGGEPNFIQQRRARQGRRRTQGRRPGVQAPRRSGRDYSHFSHATSQHRLACDACHTIPTSNWPKASGYPDVADYPDHSACLRCHRQQFFSGARPTICAGCHTVVSPRNGSRFPFPKENQAHQFKIEFPHDKHQDVIASARPMRETDGGVLFVRASFAHAPRPQDNKADKTNNCSICHLPDQRKYTPPPDAGWPPAAGVPPGTFETMPSSHASCFNCHWKSQEPTSENCAGCHKLSSPYRPEQWPKRISAKFFHSEPNHLNECTTCHINITKAGNIKGLKTDVPISSCKDCHKAKIGEEIAQRGKDAKFACVYCHTTDIGRRPTPPTHDAALN